MNVTNMIGVIWFEIIFSIALCSVPYIVYVQSIWMYMVATAVMYLCVRTVCSRTGKKIKIHGQGVVITGCDTGFGHDLAVRLDAIGFTVFAGCLHESWQGARKLKAECSKKLQIIPLDVCSDQSVEHAFHVVTKYLQRKGLWAVVNNAGLNIFGDVELCTVDVCHKAMDINLYGYIRMVQVFLPLIRKAKGRIINVSSVMGRTSIPGRFGYCATKHAVETLSDALRLEMVKFGVKVIIMEPGHFGGATGCSSESMMKHYDEELDEMWERASEDFRRIHTRKYIDTIMESRRQGVQISAPTTTPVIDAFQDAITNKIPKTRYLVDGSNKLVDMHGFFARVHGFMPTWMYDYLIIKWTKCDKTLSQL